MVECPSCHETEARKIVKNGCVYRKKKEGTATSSPRGARVMRYQCTECGYTSRGSSFGLPETEEEEEEYLKNRNYTISVPEKEHKKPIIKITTKNGLDIQVVDGETREKNQ